MEQNMNNMNENQNNFSNKDLFVGSLMVAGGVFVAKAAYKAVTGIAIGIRGVISAKAAERKLRKAMQESADEA